MKVAIVGTGYVGLVTGACLAAGAGHDVICVDLDPAKLKATNDGRAPFYEPGLDDLLATVVGTRLTATSDLGEAVARSEMTMLAVGTPSRAGEIDLTALEHAAEGVGRALRRSHGRHVVVVKSTVVPGTTDGLVRSTLERASGRRAGADFGLAANPEFLTEGQAVEDFQHPDRLVFGGIDATSLEALDELYSSFPAEVPRIRTTTRTAEMIKYASNALLATLISFSNVIADLCAAAGEADVVDVMHGVHSSQYLTPIASGPGPVRAPIASFLAAGCGFGGSCLPKDVAALAAYGEAAGVDVGLLRSVLDVNRGRPEVVVGRLRRQFGTLRDVAVAVLGLAFKPDTDDVRESPAIPIVERLLAEGAVVSTFDPVAGDKADALFCGRVQRLASLEETVKSDAIVLVTRWPEFQRLPELLAGAADPPLLLDGRRVIVPEAVVRYDGIGR